jgi:hypothetical protein
MPNSKSRSNSPKSRSNSPKSRSNSSKSLFNSSKSRSNSSKSRSNSSKSRSNSSKTSSRTLKIIKKIQSKFRDRQKKTQKVKTIQRQFRKFRSYPICALCLEPITNTNKLNFYCTKSQQHKYHDACIFNFVNSFSFPYPAKISCPQCRDGNIELKFNKLNNKNITEGKLIKKSFHDFSNRLFNTSTKIYNLKKSDKFKNVELNEYKIINMKSKLDSLFNSLNFLHKQVIDANTLIETFKQENNQKMLKNIQDNLDYIKAFKGIIEEYLDIIDNLHNTLDAKNNNANTSKNKNIKKSSSTSSSTSTTSSSSQNAKTTTTS